MATPPIDSLAQEIRKRLGVGSDIYDSSDTKNGTTSSVLYASSAGKLAAGNIPFTVPLNAGVTDTSYSVVSIEGSATGSADELMHLTLVSGANATATIAGFYRITITDDAGVITTGKYYAPFYTLA